MPAYDQCHPKFARALQKDGWQVNSSQQRISHEDRVIFLDMRASRQMNGSLLQMLLAEIKCFLDRNSTTPDLYSGLGQYIVYRAMLAERGIDIPLYLGVPEDIFREIFDSTILRAINDNQIKLLIVNLDTETIAEWKE